MILNRAYFYPALFFGIMFGGLFVTMVAVKFHPLAPIVLAVGGLCGVLILVRPFLGLMMIALFAQLDALAGILFHGLPVSAFKLLAAGTLAGLILSSYAHKEALHRSFRDPSLQAAFLFAGVLILSSFFADVREASLWAIRRQASLLILLFLCVSLIQTREQLKIVLYCIIAATFIASVTVVVDSLTGQNLFATSVEATTAEWQGISRSSGASNKDPTTAASMLLAGIVIAMVLAFETSQGRRRTIWMVVAAIGSMALVLSLVRSSAIVLVIAGLWMAWFHRNSMHFPRAVFFGLIVLFAVLPLVPAEYWQRLATLTGSGGPDWTLGRRLTYNIVGLDLVWQNPLFGVGPGNFQFHYLDQEYRFLPGRTFEPRRLHNMYLSVFVEAGVLGFTCFVAMIGFAFSGLVKTMAETTSPEMRSLSKAVLIAFGAYLIVSVSLPNEYNKYTWMLTGIAAAIAQIHRNETEAQVLSESTNPLDAGSINFSHPAGEQVASSEANRWGLSP